MIKNFSYSIEQKVLFEPGCIKKIPKILKAMNHSKVYIISDRGLEKAGIVKRMTDIFDSAGIEYKTFLDVEGNPSVDTVNKAWSGFEDSGAGILVALGGGSPMDVSKAVAVLDTFGGEITDYMTEGKITGETTPVLAVATTAGTGSESTIAAIITDTDTDNKFAVVSPYILPKYAILDPELITTLPASVAASTGVDALVHAVEAYLSPKTTVFTDALEEKAIELIGKYLRRFTANRQDLEAAGGMLAASNLAATAFARASLGIVHALSHPVGGVFNVPHGIANSILFPAVLEFHALADNGRYEKMYRLLKGNGYHYENFCPEMLIQEIRDLIAVLGIPSKLSEVGVTEDKIPEMAVTAMESGDVPNNPRQVTLKDAEELYRKSY